MRYVERDRIEPPKIFGSPDMRRARERVVEFFSASPDKTSQTRFLGSSASPGEQDILRALYDLFGGHCSFCETRHDIDRFAVMRLRPSAYAEPASDPSVSHLYYIWLENAWQNLYPVCSECWPQQERYFPVASNRRCPLPTEADLQAYVMREDGRWPTFPVDEQPVFLDPCYDRKLWRHLQFDPGGSVSGRDRRGRETIAHFKLDRPTLASRRGAFFKLQIGNFRQMLSAVTQEPNTFDLFNFDQIEFGGAWHILLRELVAIALDRRTVTDVTGQALELSDQSDGLESFDRAVSHLQARGSGQTILQVGIRSPAPAPSSEPAAIPAAFRIRNFKSLETIDFAMPPAPKKGDVKVPSLLILGENAAGKSTILEAIAITLMGPDRRRLLGLEAGRLVLNPKYMGADEQVHPDKASVEISYEGGESQTLTIAPGTASSGKKYVARDYVDAGAGTTLPLFAYGAFRQYLSAERRYSQHKHVRSLFAPDQLLSNPEKWLLRLSAAQFNMVVRALREVFSVEGSFEVLERTPDGVFVIAAVEDGPDGRLQRTPLSVVSSGFRAVLAMLCDVMQGLMDKRINPGFETLETTRGLVLIDEVEAHLHPRWKMAIMTGLRRALPEVIFIATSHDPLCLRGMDKGEVMVLERIPGKDADTQLPVFTQSLVDLPDNQNWTIEQLLTADFFNLRSTANLDAEKHIAEMEDRLARGVKPEDDPELRQFLSGISRDLPIGDSETRRLVQEAVGEYLVERRSASDDKLKRLRRQTKDEIIAALRAAG